MAIKKTKVNNRLDTLDSQVADKISKQGGTVTGVLNASGVQVDGSNVYHSGNKPTSEDIGAYPKEGGVISGHVVLAKDKGVKGKDGTGTEKHLINIHGTTNKINVGDSTSEILIVSNKRPKIWDGNKEGEVLLKTDSEIRKGINGFMKMPIGDVEFIQQWGEFNVYIPQVASTGVVHVVTFPILFPERVVTQNAICTWNNDVGEYSWTSNINCSAVATSGSTMKIEIRTIHGMEKDFNFLIRWSAMGY